MGDSVQQKGLRHLKRSLKKPLVPVLLLTQCGLAADSRFAAATDGKRLSSPESSVQDGWIGSHLSIAVCTR